MHLYLVAMVMFWYLPWIGWHTYKQYVYIDCIRSEGWYNPDSWCAFDTLFGMGILRLPTVFLLRAGLMCYVAAKLWGCVRRLLLRIFSRGEA